MEITEGAISAVKKINEKWIFICNITNQPAIAKGIITLISLKRS